MKYPKPISEALVAAAIALSCIQVLGCDSASESDEAAFELRVFTSTMFAGERGELIEKSLLSDTMIVDVAKLSSGNEAAFSANSLKYEGRNDLPFDGSDLVWVLYVDRDGDAAFLPSLSGGGGFLCGFKGDDVVEEFDGTIFAFTAAPTRRKDVQRSTLPYRARRIDCANDYDAVDAEYVDTLRIDPTKGVIPWNRLHTIRDLSEDFLEVELEQIGYDGRVLPIILSKSGREDDLHWLATVLEPSAEKENVYSGTVFSESSLCYLVILTVPAG